MRTMLLVYVQLNLYTEEKKKNQRSGRYTIIVMIVYSNRLDHRSSFA